MAQSSGYLALKWNNHNRIFAKILDDLRLQEEYCDVSLSCGGQFFSAHKFVLATCSDYFKEMFSRTPCKHPIVYMSDVAPQDMEALLHFMYRGEVHVAENEVASLLRTAEGLQVKGLAVPDNPPGSAPLPVGVTPTTVPEGTPATFLPTLVAKRKRQSESVSRRDELPKLKKLPVPTNASPQLNSPQLQTTSDNQNDVPSTPRMAGPPLLKRIKIARLVQDTTISTVETTVKIMNGPDNESTYTLDGSLGNVSLHGPEDCEQQNNQTSMNVNENSDDRSICSSNEGALVIGTSPIKSPHTSPTHNAISKSSSTDERRADEEEDNSSRQSHSSYIKEEAFQSNGPVDNDDETCEVLQVDLSEDGTRFIIGPGGRMQNSEDATDEDTNDGQKKPFVCPLCGHDFTRRDNLANHLKTHTGDRPYMCQYCHKCFSRKDYLKQHERIHTGEKPYQCPQCDRAFTRKEGMTDHLRCHSDNKEFACDACPKSFKQKCGLRFHKRNYKH